MQVADLMQQQVITVNPDQSLAEVVLAMADAHISALPVVAPNGQIVGVISASDLLAAEAEVSSAEARSLLAETTTAKELMTPVAHLIAPEAHVRDAAQRMLYADVHRLFVTNEGRLVGVISATDIVRGVATNLV